ncbi:preprotein translocase subunit SecG [uncultured Erythrobacter sp.]|uniref:preprotein translocase subunit SecG n=1 Tax=uncultured Erythrobacter sp. TaxID=263913 RepID=UPI00262EA9B2|nr:preprotein translocase subunit SecG [uncultured Erythrobacter sp.]
MSLFIILTVIQAIVAAALVAVVLMQRSEGGGLGIGGNPSGALGARGAADFLTRSTRWLAIAFVGLSITLAALAVNESSLDDITSDLDRNVTAPSADDLLGESSDGEGSAAASTEDLLGEPASDDPLAE